MPNGSPPTILIEAQMLHFHDNLGTCIGSKTSVLARCGFDFEFDDAFGYCLDAPRWMPAGSTVRIEPTAEQMIEPFAAPETALRL
jgi:hypothetical protein